MYITMVIIASALVTILVETAIFMISREYRNRRFVLASVIVNATTNIILNVCFLLSGKEFELISFPVLLAESIVFITEFEAARLCATLSEKWHEGLLALQKTDVECHKMELSLAEALDIQFASAARILRFYEMRHALTTAQPQDSRCLLLAMRRIVQQEITASERLAELCEQDGRLGYHSEAEVFKYFPEKLRWRAKQLKKLLDTDFKDARQTLSEGDPLEEYLFEDERNVWTEGEWREVGNDYMRWRFSVDSETVKVEAEFSGHHDYPETAWLILYDREGFTMPLPAMHVSKQPSMETYRGWLAEFTVPRAALGYASQFRLGIERTEYLPNGTTRASNSRKDTYPRIYRLNLGVSMIDKTEPVLL